VRTRLLFLLLLPLSLMKAQEGFPLYPAWGFRAGAVLAFGTHFQRAGLCLNFYYVAGHGQVNAETRAYFDVRSLGPRLPHPELCLSLGVLGGFGGKDLLFNPFLSPVSNQTGYKYCVAYSYNIYLNRIRTRQVTGLVHFGFTRASLIIENDIFAKPALDRFRSGALLLQWRHEALFEAGLSSTIWTGHYRTRSSISGIPAFYHNCYMDTTGGTYTHVSHGLLLLQVKWLLPYSQYVQAGAGVDAEQVRNTIQNRLLHNMRFVPEEINKARNCHLPMLDTTGAPFLYRPGQKVRAPKAFLNLYSNPHIFY
jgi:hypothetical protein